MIQSDRTSASKILWRTHLRGSPPTFFAVKFITCKTSYYFLGKTSESTSWEDTFHASFTCFDFIHSSKNLTRFVVLLVLWPKNTASLYKAFIRRNTCCSMSSKPCLIPPTVRRDPPRLSRTWCVTYSIKQKSINCSRSEREPRKHLNPWVLRGALPPSPTMQQGRKQKAKIAGLRRKGPPMPRG